MNTNDVAPVELINIPVHLDKSEQVSKDAGELKDFQRKETVYENMQDKYPASSGHKAIKTIGVILAALILLLLVLVNNTSSHGPGLDPDHLLEAGVIFVIASLLIRKILSKQE